MKDFVKVLKEECPYPEDIFIEPTTEEWEQFHVELRNRGIVGDAYMGAAARLGWNNCIKMLEEMIKEGEDARVRTNRKGRKSKTITAFQRKK